MPRRGQLIRVLYCEIGRILSPLLNVTTQAMDVGALTPPLWGLEARETRRVFSALASGRRTRGAVGGTGGVGGSPWRDGPLTMRTAALVEPISSSRGIP